MDYNRLLEGKTALITGGAQGLGRQIALLFARHGARVAIADVVTEEGFKTERELRDYCPDAFFLRVDMGVKAEVDRLIEAVNERFGHVDILDNNVGINYYSVEQGWPIMDTQVLDETFDRIVSVNLKGAYRLVRAFLPGMLKRGGGCILFTSTIHAHMTVPNNVSYCTSKSALTAFARALAAEYAGRGVRVNVIAPGGIRSSLSFGGSTWHLLPDIERRLRSWCTMDPGAYMGLPIDIANAHLFFASGMSEGVQGQTLLSDSGASAYIHSCMAFDYPDEHPLSWRMPYRALSAYCHDNDDDGWRALLKPGMLDALAEDACRFAMARLLSTGRARCERVAEGGKRPWVRAVLDDGRALGLRFDDMPPPAIDRAVLECIEKHGLQTPPEFDDEDVGLSLDYARMLGDKPFSIIGERGAVYDALLALYIAQGGVYVEDAALASVVAVIMPGGRALDEGGADGVTDALDGVQRALSGAVPRMRNMRGGFAVLICDARAEVYAAAAHALAVGFSLDHGKYNIRANCVLYDGDMEGAAGAAARAALFFSTPMARNVLGQTLYVDGGRSTRAGGTGL